MNRISASNDIMLERMQPNFEHNLLQSCIPVDGLKSAGTGGPFISPDSKTENISNSCTSNSSYSCAVGATRLSPIRTSSDHLDLPFNSKRIALL